MSKSQASLVKKEKVKMLLFFLFLTTFIWFLTKFSKEFTATVEASLVYSNIPNNTVIANDNPDTISFDLTANGFDFLYHKLKKPIIDVNVSEYYTAGELLINIPNNELIKMISEQINSIVAVKNVSIQNFKIVLDSINSRKIPVKLVSEIVYKNGFKPIGEINIKPDSIVISGPSILIDSITEIKTTVLTLKNIETTIVEEIDVVISSNKEISYSDNKVTVEIKVKEFTQKFLTVPLKISNLPPEITIKLIPNVTTVLFDVSVEEYNLYSEKDFVVICDYSKRNDVGNFIIPEISIKPDNIQNLEIQVDKINYLIFK